MNLKRKKVAGVIGSFSEDEMQRLRNFFKSPYHVKPVDASIFARMLALLRNVMAGKCEAIWEDDQLNHRLFPKSDFVKGKIEKKFSQFTMAVIQFIGLEQMHSGSAIDLNGLKYLRNRNEKSLYDQELKRIKKKISADNSTEEDAYLLNFELNLEECRYMNNDTFRNNQESFDNVYRSLDYLYTNYYIYLGIRNLTLNNFTKPGEMGTRFEMPLSLMQKRNNKDKSTTQLFEEHIFQNYLTDQSSEHPDIQKMYKELEEVKQNLHPAIYNDYRTVIRGTIISAYNSGDLSLGPTLFDLYKNEVESGATFFAAKISSSVVNNITTVALRENQTEWLQHFLQKIDGKILEAYLEPFILALNRSKLLFAQQQFQAVLDTLSFEVKEMYLKLSARVLEVMAHFELKTDLLSYKIEAYKLFVFRLPKDKVGADFIKGHHNFIRIVRSMSHSKTEFDLKRIQGLLQKVQATKILAERKWLLQKLTALENKNM